MITHRLNEIAESFINGNITDTKKALKHMSKSDLVEFITIFAESYSIEGASAYMDTVRRIQRLL